MMRNLKVMALALGIMLVLGATASVASAAEEFHSESGSTELSGEQPAAFNDKFTTDSGNVECENVTYSGSVSGATSEETELAPSYSGCTAAFGLGVTVDMNGCKFKITWRARVLHIICTFSFKIHITTPGCVVTVPPQTGINGISFDSTTGPPKDIDVTFNANNIIYEEHNKGFFPTCANNTKLTSNGSYSGSATIKGFSGGKQVGIWYE